MLKASNQRQFSVTLLAQVFEILICNSCANAEESYKGKLLCGYTLFTAANFSIGASYYGTTPVHHLLGAVY